MRPRTLLTQVLLVNASLVAITAFVAAVVARDQFEASRESLLLLALSVFCAVLLNSLLLRRRLEPIERLVETMERIDLADPGTRASVPKRSAREIKRLERGLNRMLERIEEERVAAGRAVLQAQEQERSRIAQDLHDEVNQALTAILLRLQATISDAPEGLKRELSVTKELANQAMEELLNLARQLRPTSLKDHGLIAALASQVRDFGERTGLEAHFNHYGEIANLSDEEQLVIYRVTQESLSNVARHAGATKVRVELNFVGRTVLRISDNGSGFRRESMGNGQPKGRPGGLGLSGMRERAILVGGGLQIFSDPEEGTTIELTIGAR